MITLDDPRHTRLRSLVNRVFTPKVVARVEDWCETAHDALSRRCSPTTPTVGVT